VSDEKISAMPSAGALNGAELVPVVKLGGNYATTTLVIAGLASPPIHYVDTSGGPASFSLPADHSAITVCEDSGTFNGITVSDPASALINDLPSFTINQRFANYTFRWNGTQWRVF
jgi:hypothetical protein